MDRFRAYLKLNQKKTEESLKSYRAPSSQGSQAGRERSLAVPHPAVELGHNPELAIQPIAYDDDIDDEEIEADDVVVEENDSEAESEKVLGKSFKRGTREKLLTHISSRASRLTDLLDHFETSGEIIKTDSSKTVRAFAEKLISDETDWVIMSKNNGIPPDMNRATGKSFRKTSAEEHFEFAYIEKSGQAHVKNYSKSLKVIQRKAANTNLLSSGARPARRVIAPDLPELEPSAAMPKQALYAEILATSYSMGGDGFVLHAGDIVLVLQFLAEYGLAEVRWQGLQGLFSVDKMKIMVPAKASESPSKLWSLTKQEVSSLSTMSLRESKVLRRLQERNQQKGYVK